VELATRACELSGWSDGPSLSTLAAAYAEVGQFQEATRWAEQALEFTPDKDKPALRLELEAYRVKIDATHTKVKR